MMKGAGTMVRAVEDHCRALGKIPNPFVVRGEAAQKACDAWWQLRPELSREVKDAIAACIARFIFHIGNGSSDPTNLAYLASIQGTVWATTFRNYLLDGCHPRLNLEGFWRAVYPLLSQEIDAGSVVDDGMEATYRSPWRDELVSEESIRHRVGGGARAVLQLIRHLGVPDKVDTDEGSLLDVFARFVPSVIE
jgi:hypothetical protein